MAGRKVQKVKSCQCYSNDSKAGQRVASLSCTGSGIPAVPGHAGVHERQSAALVLGSSLQPFVDVLISLHWFVTGISFSISDHSVTG